MGEELPPQRLDYLRLPPPPVKHGPPIFAAVAVGVLPLLFVVVNYFGPGRSDPDFVGFRWVLRGIVYAWLGAVWGLVWSIREVRRRERAWRDAQAPDDRQMPR
ncbi:MAG: hypothetical protein JWN40_3115 [Phycisphaerales bacterium]|nr:hypothetical protein [Phycisphaerales bacterium]